MLPSTVIEAWRFSSDADSSATVLPDGCRDLIWRAAPDGRGGWIVSELAGGAAQVACAAGEQFAGFRFRPGAEFGEQRLLDAVAARDARDEAAVLAIVDDLVRVDARVAEALDALARCRSVGEACGRLGVGERSLERLLRAATGKPPGFWKALARARHAAHAVSGPLPLPEVALAHGYADQAHMTREFQRWFGCAPRRLRAAPGLLGLAQSAGYA